MAPDTERIGLVVDMTSQNITHRVMHKWVAEEKEGLSGLEDTDGVIRDQNRPGPLQPVLHFLGKGAARGG